jgi:hypothetical protein
VNAGSDKFISQSYLTLVGSAYDPDGYISSYQWTKISGPTCLMSNTTTAKLFTSKLASGTYYFRLTAKDNKGAIKYDDVKMVVSNSTASVSTGSTSTSTSLANLAPTVNAGSDKYITLPRNYITLVGSASDRDGTVVSYNWSKLSGGSLLMDNQNTPKLWTNKLLAGTYTFRLTVRDNDGAVKSDDVKLTVKYSTASLILKVPSRRVNIMEAVAQVQTLPYRVLTNNRGLVRDVLHDRRKESEVA